jgi:hypothetical protein
LHGDGKFNGASLNRNPVGAFEIDPGFSLGELG